MTTMEHPPKRSAPELLTVGEVADRLRVSEGTVYSLLRSGALPAVKIGSQWRVSADRLSLYLTSQTAEAKG